MTPSRYFQDGSSFLLFVTYLNNRGAPSYLSLLGSAPLPDPESVPPPRVRFTNYSVLHKVNEGGRERGSKGVRRGGGEGGREGGIVEGRQG